jgi:CheY-like chemotaxis protein
MARKVLVIDDDADLVAMIKMALEGHGFEVAAATSGEAALQVLDGGFRADGLVLDVMMAGRADGIIFARKLRKNDKYKSIPILMLTGMREATGYGPLKDDPRDPVFLPVDVFLEKPIKQADLVARMDEMLGGRS